MSLSHEKKSGQENNKPLDRKYEMRLLYPDDKIFDRKDLQFSALGNKNLLLSRDSYTVHSTVMLSDHLIGVQKIWLI